MLIFRRELDDIKLFFSFYSKLLLFFIMAQKVQTTSISNAQLKHLLTLGDTYCINVENGVWDVESGTYNFVKKAVGHVKCEMAKQARQRRKTMNIEVVTDPERQQFLRQNYLDKVEE